MPRPRVEPFGLCEVSRWENKELNKRYFDRVDPIPIPETRKDGTPITQPDKNWIYRFQRMKIPSLMMEAGFENDIDAERLIELREALEAGGTVDVSVLQAAVLSNILRLMASQNHAACRKGTELMANALGMNKIGFIEKRLNKEGVKEKKKSDEPSEEEVKAQELEEAKKALGLE